MNVLLDLFLTFGYLSLISVGGAMTIVPEMERQIVVVHGWMDHRAFVEAYALGQFAPGPNMLHVFVVGDHVAGVPGAIAAGLGMFGPTSLLLAGVAWLSTRPEPPGWIAKLQLAMGPITLGLMGAAAWTLGKGLEHGALSLGIVVTAALLTGRGWLGPATVVLLAALAGGVAGAYGI